MLPGVCRARLLRVVRGSRNQTRDMATEVAMNSTMKRILGLLTAAAITGGPLPARQEPDEPNSKQEEPKKQEPQPPDKPKPRPKEEKPKQEPAPAPQPKQEEKKQKERTK